MVRANTSPVTVIMVADTTTRIPRASSAVPSKASGHSGESASTDTRDSSAPAIRKAMTDTVGSTPTGDRRGSPTAPDAAQAGSYAASGLCASWLGEAASLSSAPSPIVLPSQPRNRWTVEG
jgi:hypothetical protein